MSRVNLTKRFVTIAVAGCCALCACSRRGAPASPSGGGNGVGPVPASFLDLSHSPGTIFQVKYSPQTVTIDLPTVKNTLKSVSPDAKVLLFDDSDPRIRQLQAGRIMFLEHIGIRRVVGAVPQGSRVAIVTEDAGLADLVQNGHIAFSVPIRPQTLSALSSRPWQPQLLPDLAAWLAPPEVYAAGGKGSLGIHTGTANGWSFTLEGESEGEGFSLSLNAEKKLAGITAAVKTTGELANISTNFNADISDGKMQSFEYSTPLKGKLHVNWDALTDGDNKGIGEARLKLPPFAKDVFDIYGLPFLFRIDEALIFKPGFGGKKDAGEGGFTLNYDGNGGFSVVGGKNSPEGQIQAEPQLEKTTTESLAPHGVVLAIDAPKVSVSLGTESFEEAIQEAVPNAALDKAAELLEMTGLGGLVKAVKEDFFKIEGAAYVQLVTEFDYAGSGPMSVVPCSMTHVNFFAQAGADAQLLSIKGESPTIDLYKTSNTIREPDIPACGNK